MRRKENLTVQKSVTMYGKEEQAKVKAIKTKSPSGNKDGYGGVPTWERTALTPVWDSTPSQPDTSWMNNDWNLCN